MTTKRVYNNNIKSLLELQLEMVSSLEEYLESGEFSFKCQNNHICKFTQSYFHHKKSQFKSGKVKFMCAECSPKHSKSLKTLEIVAEEILQLNISLTPIKYTCSYRVTFKCLKCNYEFETSIAYIRKGYHCPKCTKEEIKQKNIQKYGVEYYFQSEDAKNIKKEKSLQKYGVEYPCQSKEIKEKIQNTVLKKYGVTSVRSLPHVQEKQKQTMIKKYGVENASHSPELFSKNRKSRFSKKKFIFKSGRIDYVQGYEPLCLNELLKTIHEDDIVTDPLLVPSIIYEKFNGVKASYYPDIYIKSLHKIIEVKSVYTFEREEERNERKLISVALEGYNCELWVYDCKHNLIKISYINRNGAILIE